MTTWGAVVLAVPDVEGGPMVSRLPSYLHPVAGRPLSWHTAYTLATLAERPERILVLAPSDMGAEAFEGLPAEISTGAYDPGFPPSVDTLPFETGRLVLVHASAALDRESVRRLHEADVGCWIEGAEGRAAAIRVDSGLLAELLDRSEPFAAANGLLDPAATLPDTSATYLVRDRMALARVHHRVRDALVRSLMAAGVTFILPDSVVVDVDVRIGRDTVVYPGVVLEGQTTVGEETVIGPGCRIIDSWVGSGVELKGWNYVANTSIRNRAILEPYVRRGFD
jgi:hypothetical protein